MSQLRRFHVVQGVEIDHEDARTFDRVLRINLDTRDGRTEKALDATLLAMSAFPLVRGILDRYGVPREGRLFVFDGDAGAPRRWLAGYLVEITPVSDPDSFPFGFRWFTREV